MILVRHNFTKIFLSAFIFAALMFVSIANIAFAAETGMMSHMSSADCVDSDCDDISLDQSCLEHCMQQAAQVEVLIFTAAENNASEEVLSSDTVQAFTFKKNEQWKPLQAIPPPARKHLLTIQKRE